MRPLKWGEDGVADSIMKAYGTANPVDVLLKNVLEESSVDEFSNDILLFWLEQRRLEIERLLVGSRRTLKDLNRVRAPHKKGTASLSSSVV